MVREAVAGPQGAGDLLQAMVGGIPRDAQFTVRVEACNVLLCRTSRAVDLCEWREGEGGEGRRGGRGVEERSGGKRWGEMSNKGRREEICLSTILENHRVKVTCISPPSLPPSLPPVTTDVQTAAAFFFETFISLSCTFGWGSVARGCVVTLQLGEGEGEGEVEGGGEGGGREVFRLGRQEGSSESSTQCNRTENSRSATDVHVYWSIYTLLYMFICACLELSTFVSGVMCVRIVFLRMAYQVISAADWESDGTVGSYSIPVATNVTEQEEDFPCPTGQYFRLTCLSG